jgi:hypothetical protein
LPTLFGNDLVLVAALNIVGEGHKHPLALIEGATQNTAVVQVLIDNLIEGLIPTSPVSRTARSHSARLLTGEQCGEGGTRRLLRSFLSAMKITTPLC